MARMGAYRLYLLLGGVSSFAFSMIFTVLAVYYVQTVGMNPLQLVLVGTAVEGTILLFEVPTGVVADVYSRRLSVILGYVLIGVCYVAQGLLPIFAAIIIAEIVRGIGDTFISGAASAWIADEIGEARVGRAYLRYGQMSQVGAFAGIGVGTLLGMVQLNLPVVLGGVLLLAMSVFLAFAMPESGFTPAPRAPGQSSWQAMGETLRTGVQVVRHHPVVFNLVLVGIVFGAFSEGIDRLWEAHFITSFALPTWLDLPVVAWIGLINAGAKLIGIVVIEVMVRRLEITGGRHLGPWLFMLSVGLIAAAVGFGLAPSFTAAIGVFWLARVLRGLQYPLMETWLNRHLSTRVRATVLSVFGQADALGQIAGGPVVGAVGLRSLRAAMVFAGLLLTPSLALYSRGTRLERDAATVAATVAPASDVSSSSLHAPGEGTES